MVLVSSISRINSGFYDVKVSKDGFKAMTVQKVEVFNQPDQIDSE